MVRAHRLVSDLQLAERKLATIASDVGFGDLSYFNRSAPPRLPTCVRPQSGLAGHNERVSVGFHALLAAGHGSQAGFWPSVFHTPLAVATTRVPTLSSPLMKMSERVRRTTLQCISTNSPI